MLSSRPERSTPALLGGPVDLLLFDAQAELLPGFLRDFAEHFCNTGVKLCAGAAPNLFLHGLEWQGFPVDAVRRHGVQRIGKRKQTCPERNLLAAMMKYGLGALEDPNWARWQIA